MYPRSSTRENGLRTVIKFMLHSPDLEPVLAMQETLLRSLIGVARGKGPESQVTTGGETWFLTPKVFGYSYEEVHLINKSTGAKMHAFARFLFVLLTCWCLSSPYVRARIYKSTILVHMFRLSQSHLSMEILSVSCHIPQDIPTCCIYLLVFINSKIACAE